MTPEWRAALRRVRAPSNPERRLRSRDRAFLAGLGLAVLTATGLLGCGRRAPVPAKSPESARVEAVAGDFLVYYAQVLRLSQTHAAQPDSFRIALDALPGSHLSPEDWEAWTRPWREDPKRFVTRVEEVFADLKPRPAVKAPVDSSKAAGKKASGSP